jgi:hypothetical protein
MSRDVDRCTLYSSFYELYNTVASDFAFSPHSLCGATYKAEYQLIYTPVPDIYRAVPIRDVNLIFPFFDVYAVISKLIDQLV